MTRLPMRSEIRERAIQLFLAEPDRVVPPEMVTSIEDSELKQGGYWRRAQIELMRNPLQQVGFTSQDIAVMEKEWEQAFLDSLIDEAQKRSVFLIGRDDWNRYQKAIREKERLEQELQTLTRQVQKMEEPKGFQPIKLLAGFHKLPEETILRWVVEGRIRVQDNLIMAEDLKNTLRELVVEEARKPPPAEIEVPPPPMKLVGLTGAMRAALRASFRGFIQDLRAERRGSFDIQPWMSAVETSIIARDWIDFGSANSVLSALMRKLLSLGIGVEGEPEIRGSIPRYVESVVDGEATRGGIERRAFTMKVSPLAIGTRDQQFEYLFRAFYTKDYILQQLGITSEEYEETKNRLKLSRVEPTG